ncbi:hypothetical protein ACNUDN_11020 [Mycobacterium sp. smrl_JER01]|uniref:hypothetical protein n=1 Tax=Mycobacterium sp. smrl_JER01 TaxID=3402633 RepID=UPI003ACB887D
MTDTVVEPTEQGAAAPVARPQPLGVFGLPLGFLLIPAGDDTDAARATLLAGRLPDAWPDRLTAHRYAVTGDRDAALAALAGDDAVTRYNRFVLDPDSADPEAVRAGLGEFGVLVDVVLFALGRSDAVPDAAGLDGELAAAVLATAASAAVAADAPTDAVRLLDAAADSAQPVSRALAGVLLGAAAGLCRTGDNAEDDRTASARLERALRLLDGADGLKVTRAELHLNAAGILHEQAAQQPELMPAAIPHYHSALQLIRREDAPLLWASGHADLATAYLTMPMVEASSQLRLGIAAQSLRQALTVFTRDEHPQRWASVQLNLANSLVYSPSRHRQENLVEAVEIYESVLATRDRDVDPHGRARVLANQGNVLAHLGVFDQAKARLYEARFLFEEHGDTESVRTVRAVLDEISREVAR